MGLLSSQEWITVYNKDGKFNPYIYAYATSDSKVFLKSKDATTIKAILKILKVNI